MHSPLRVLFITAEAEPFVKIGGLGDYAGSLPKAISEFKSSDSSNVDIRVVLPFHGGIEATVPPLTKIASIKVQTNTGYAKGIVFQFAHQGITYYLVKRSGNPSGYKNVYNPTQIEDARKYIFFSLACLEFIKVIDWSPDIIHANDWHTAISVYELAEKRRADKFYRSVRSLLTVHNLPFTGEGSQPTLREFQLKPLKSILLPSWAKFLPLPMGLENADEIVAVSPTYAQELKQEEFGNGLVDFFFRNTHKTTGILNGIDTSTWDPATDECLSQNYSINQMEKRNINKEKILQEFGLGNNIKKPLLVLISRLTPQKGIDILLQGLPHLFDDEWSAIFLGSGQHELEKGLIDLESQIPDRFKVVLEFNNPLAHRLYASGDILLMPSLYEPCGLSQLIAMRYGCIPVARAVGGLKDSIIAEPPDLRTGYLFEKADGLTFANCLRKALSDYKNKKKWISIQKRAMNVDFSWKKSAGQYLDLYKAMLSVKIGTK
ncbi:MAG: glycogen/starch synthase [Pelolinea sp.]|nr:glycogen/starch synthase [Pelolinea sp.]